MDWKAAAAADDPSTVAGGVFQGLKQLEEIRKSEKAFVSYAATWTIETWDQSVLCIGRYYEGEKIIGLFNFSEQDRTAWINETDGLYEDMLNAYREEERGPGSRHTGVQFLLSEESIDDCKVPMGCPTKHFIA